MPLLAFIYIFTPLKNLIDREQEKAPYRWNTALPLPSFQTESVALPTRAQTPATGTCMGGTAAAGGVFMGLGLRGVRGIAAAAGLGTGRQQAHGERGHDRAEASNPPGAPSSQTQAPREQLPPHLLSPSSPAARGTVCSLDKRC